MAVMLATSTGVGVWTVVTTWLFGVPMGPVAALAVPGVIIVALSTVEFDTTNGMSASVAAAYKLLDRKLPACGAKEVLPWSLDIPEVTFPNGDKPAQQIDCPRIQ